MACVLLCSLFLLSFDWFILPGKGHQQSDINVVGNPSSGPIVTTTYGPIQGYTTQINGTKDQKFAQVFLGVPYAKPPVGKLRFEKPQPPNPWTAVKQATKFGNICIGIGQDDGKEDCLTLNVFAPVKSINDTKLLPVYFYVHGGSFIFLSSANFGKDIILTNVVSENIVVVTINYRLGPLGFLFTDLPGQTPNVGILDQIQALKWVRDNIDRFGGDPKRVTLSGESAGGASVSWITISPLSRGLYAQTFPMSGSALDIWASKPDVVRNNTKKLIGMLKCNNTKNVVKCLKAIPLEQFWQIAKQIVHDNDTVDFGVWHPVFHESLVGTKVRTIAQAMENAPGVPSLHALNSQETKNWVITESGGGKYYPISYNQGKNLTEKHFFASINALYGLHSIFGNNTSEAVSSIFKFYTNESKAYSKYPCAGTLVQSISDVLFVIGQMREARHRAKFGAPVYFFLNECVDNSNPVVAGCGHGSISYYVFRNSHPEVQRIILPIIIRFIKTGEPWEGYRVNSTTIPYFHASATGGFSDSLWPERVKFWNKFYNTFGFDWPSGSRDQP